MSLSRSKVTWYRCNSVLSHNKITEVNVLCENLTISNEGRHSFCCLLTISDRYFIFMPLIMDNILITCMSQSLQSFWYLVSWADRWIVSNNSFSDFLHLGRRIPAWMNFDLVFMKLFKTCLQPENEYRYLKTSVENMITPLLWHDDPNRTGYKSV